MVLFSATAFADEPQEEQGLGVISDVKITVGYDSFFYKAKLFFEKVRITNAFTQAGKANVAGIFAKRRIAEAQLMLEKGSLDEAQELIISGIGYISEATAHVGEALFIKDNGRSRTVLENISNIQSGVLEYLDYLESGYPGVFDTQPMAADLNKTLADTIVLWSYLSYKDSFFGDPDMRARALTVLEEKGFQPDVISSATADIIPGPVETAGESVTDAITSATYSLMEGSGDVVGGGGIDTLSSATPATVPPETAVTDGVDAVSSATTTTEPTGGQPAPAGDSGVDAVSSATPSASTGTSPAQPAVSYDDDEHEEDDDEHEEEDDDD